MLPTVGDVGPPDASCDPDRVDSSASEGINAHSVGACFGARRPVVYDATDLAAGENLALQLFEEGEYHASFDLSEQLVGAFPAAALHLLVQVHDRFQRMPDADSRYAVYQSRYFDFGIVEGDKVLDIGSGNVPFPLASHLADLAVEDDYVGRAGQPFRYLDGKPVFECDVEAIPFGDKEFDFVYCSHVLEHVGNPERACKELMRVAKRGYVETPTRGKDLWLNCASPSNHKWAIERLGQTLIFTEYTQRDIDGFQCDVLLNMHCAPQTEREKALSALIYLKADLLNTMLLWDGSFGCEVRRQPSDR